MPIQESYLVPLNEIDEIISLFEDIAVEQGWQPGDQLTAHVYRSAYFAVKSNGVLVGGIQLELPVEGGGWSYQAVWPDIAPTNNATSAYVAMFAFAKEHRGDRLQFWLPCIEVWRYCRSHEIEDLWLAATPTTLAAYRRLGWPLEIRSEPRLHWGEECYLTGMSVDAVEASVVNKAAKSETYRKVIERAFHADNAAATHPHPLIGRKR